MMKPWLTFMGSFITDLTFQAARLPAWGESVLGTGFRVGPGGKGSNQAIAAARLGARVCFIGALADDGFGAMARAAWRDEGIDTSFCTVTDKAPTGAAAVIVDPSRGENAIVVDPGSGMHLTVHDVERAASRIAESAVFVTQLELNLDVVSRGLFLAKRAGAITILNPAPAQRLPAHIYDTTDYLTPNELEAAALLGRTLGDPEEAALALRGRGVPNVIITLGDKGAIAMSEGVCERVPAFDAGPVVETTGAGDAFTGALAVALAQGMDIVAATRFGCKVAGVSVTRPGTAASMPARAELPG